MKRLMYWTTLAVLVVCSAGCATTPLTNEGRNVTIYTGASVSLVANCQRLAVLHVTSKGFDAAGRLISDENELRNQTARLGGDSVAITNLDPLARELMGVAYKCNTPKR